MLVIFQLAIRRGNSMSVAKTNQKLMQRLRVGLDLGATRAALDRGKITPRQAQNVAITLVASRKFALAAIVGVFGHYGVQAAPAISARTEACARQSRMLL